MKLGLPEKATGREVEGRIALDPALEEVELLETVRATETAVIDGGVSGAECVAELEAEGEGGLCDIDGLAEGGVRQERGGGAVLRGC